MSNECCIFIKLSIPRLTFTQYDSIPFDYQKMVRQVSRFQR